MRYLFILLLFPAGALIGLKSVTLGSCFFLWNNLFQPFEWAYRDSPSAAAYGAFAVLLLSYVIGVVTGRVRVRMNALIYGTLALLTWLLICSIAAPISDGRFDALVQTGKYLVPVLLISSSIGSGKDVKLIAAVLMLSVGIWTMEYGLETMLSGVNRHMSIPGGQMTDNNDFAAAVAGIIPMAVYFLYAYRGLWRKTVKFLAGILALLCVATVVFSDSRGAALTVAGEAVLFVAFVSKTKVRDAVVLAAVIGITAVFLLPESFYARMSTIETEQAHEESSTNRRLNLMRGAWSATLDHPLFGLGPGNWLVYAKRYARDPHEPHSIWFKVSSESGLPGLALYATVLGVILGGLFRMRTRARRHGDHEGSLLATAILMVIVGLLVAFSFLSHPFSEFLWAWLAIGNAYARIYRPPARPVKPR